MFASVIEFKDAALMAHGVIETSGALTRALQSDSFSLFGPDTFRHGICGAAEADLSLVATLLVSGEGFRECSAEIASGLLLFSGVCLSVTSRVVPSHVLCFSSVFRPAKRRSHG